MTTAADSEWTDENDRAPGSDDDNVSRGTPTDDDNVSRGTPTDDDNDAGDDNDDDNDAGDDRARLRGEAARYRRQRNEHRERADEYGQRLFTELVRATGRLTDPSDMPVDPTLLDDPDQLTGAIDKLLEAKPHLKARQFKDMGQHDRGKGTGVSLGELLRRSS